VPRPTSNREGPFILVTRRDAGPADVTLAELLLPDDPLPLDELLEEPLELEDAPLLEELLELEDDPVLEFPAVAELSVGAEVADASAAPPPGETDTPPHAASRVNTTQQALRDRIAIAFIR
jgi:hypothetical protein